VFVTGFIATGACCPVPGHFETIAYNTATGGRLWAALTGPPGISPAAVAISQTANIVVVTGTNGSEYQTVAYRP
jgi:hypothetical protein